MSSTLYAECQINWILLNRYRRWMHHFLSICNCFSFSYLSMFLRLNLKETDLCNINFYCKGRFILTDKLCFVTCFLNQVFYYWKSMCCWIIKHYLTLNECYDFRWKNDMLRKYRKMGSTILENKRFRGFFHFLACGTYIHLHRMQNHAQLFL